MRTPQGVAAGSDAFGMMASRLLFAFTQNRTRGIRDGRSFGGSNLTAHTLACLRFAGLVTATNRSNAGPVAVDSDLLECRLGRACDFVSVPSECALERVSLALSNPERDRVILIGPLPKTSWPGSGSSSGS